MSKGGDLNKRGLPDMSKSEGDKAVATFSRIMAVGTFLLPGIGLAMGMGVHRLRANPKIDAKITLLAEHDLQWLYLAAFLFNRVVNWLNNYPMLHKSRVMRGKSGNLRANMYIYTTYNDADRRAVLLDEEGDAGKYNRANRSLHHFIENVPAFCVGLLLAGFVYPLATFVATCAFCAGRVLHQVEYSSSGYGAHAAGFLVAMFAGLAVDGMILNAALKAGGWL